MSLILVSMGLLSYCAVHLRAYREEGLRGRNGLASRVSVALALVLAAVWVFRALTDGFSVVMADDLPGFVLDVTLSVVLLSDLFLDAVPGDREPMYRDPVGYVLALVSACMFASALALVLVGGVA